MHDDVQLRTANPVQRVMQWFASLRPVAFVFRHTFHLVDRALLRPLRGRTLSSVVAGIPNIMLTTTGARTGQRRTVPARPKIDSYSDPSGTLRATTAVRAPPCSTHAFGSAPRL